jgi:hypothetical protein
MTYHRTTTSRRDSLRREALINPHVQANPSSAFAPASPDQPERGGLDIVGGER